MKKLLHLEIAFIMHTLCSNFSFAQNLVVNPSFEVHSECPNNWGRIYFSTGWFQPNNFNGTVNNSSSTDYYNECSTFSPTEVPTAGFGFQYAHDGSAFAGIYSYDNFGFNFREYIEGQLLQPLEAGKRYCVSFYVSLADEFMFGINKMGLHFSVDSVLYNDPSYGYLPLIPHVKNPENNIITDTINWVLISGCYYASGQEKFITIGNFFSNVDTDTTFVKDSVEENAYYYIDDVSVILCDTDTVVPPTIDSFIEIPNIFTPDGDGLNELFYIENLPEKSQLQIFNRWDRVVFNTSDYKNNWNAGDVVAGVYYYFLTLPDGKLYKGFVHVIK